MGNSFISQSFFVVRDSFNSLFLEGTFTVQASNVLSVSGPGCQFSANVLAIGHSLQFCWDDFVRWPPLFLNHVWKATHICWGLGKKKANIGLQNAETCSPNLLPECNDPFGGFSNAWGIS